MNGLFNKYLLIFFRKGMLGRIIHFSQLVCGSLVFGRRSCQPEGRQLKQPLLTLILTLIF